MVRVVIALKNKRKNKKGIIKKDKEYKENKRINKDKDN
jgi:hypothetical protein